MFVAHVAGGYLITRSYLHSFNRFSLDDKSLKYYLIFGLVCSVLPDIDLFYFYLIDHRQHPHHTYWTHIPLFWVLCTGFLFFMAKAISNKNRDSLWVILLLNTELHMVLDSVAGGIFWLYPFNHEYFRIFKVTARFDWWVLNYIFHWTFLLELLIITVAVFVYYQDRKTAQGTMATQYES